MRKLATELWEEWAGQTHQKVERLALRAVAPRRAARWEGRQSVSATAEPPAERGLVRSQRDRTHHLDFIGFSDFDASALAFDGITLQKRENR